MRENRGMTERPIVIARLNARLQPLDRGTLYEDPLDAALRRAELGAVTGGGTLQDTNGEIELCDIEVELTDSSERSLELVRELLERLGAPKGSSLIVAAGGRELPFGSSEGLALYLNGTDLPDEVYRDSDVNHVYDELNRLLDGIGAVHSYWEGPTETALYAYGTSFESMRDALSGFLQSYPLCEKARVVQIA
jgi:hypothetical protein